MPLLKKFIVSKFQSVFRSTEYQYHFVTDENRLICGLVCGIKRYFGSLYVGHWLVGRFMKIVIYFK